MAAIILTAGQTAGNSSEIIVGDGVEVLISLFTDNGSPIPYGVIMTIQRQTVVGGWQSVSTVGIGTIVLRNDCSNLVLSAPGTYRVARRDISAFGVNVGVEQE